VLRTGEEITAMGMNTNPKYFDHTKRIKPWQQSILI
jgi:hypothetical protein